MCVYICIYIYTYIHIYMYIHVHIYIYRERQREGTREKESRKETDIEREWPNTLQHTATRCNTLQKRSRELDQHWRFEIREMTLQVQQAVSTYYIIPDCFMTTCKITTDMMLSHVYVCEVTHQYVCMCVWMCVYVCICVQCDSSICVYMCVYVCDVTHQYVCVCVRCDSSKCVYTHIDESHRVTSRCDSVT